MQKLLNVKEAAAYLRIAVPTLYRWAEEHRIKHIRLGRRILFRMVDLDRHVEANVVNQRSGSK